MALDDDVALGDTLLLREVDSLKDCVALLESDSLCDSVALSLAELLDVCDAVVDALRLSVSLGESDSEALADSLWL